MGPLGANGAALPSTSTLDHWSALNVSSYAQGWPPREHAGCRPHLGPRKWVSLAGALSKKSLEACGTRAGPKGDEGEGASPFALLWVLF